MTDPLSQLSLSIVALQRSLAVGRQTGRPAAARSSATVAASDAPTAARSALQSLPQRIGTLPTQASARRKHFLRHFVEAVLCDEWGDELSLDAQGQRLLSRVLDALEQDAEGQRLVDEAIEEWLSHAQR